MNFLLRLQNKSTLTALISGVLLITKTILEANGIGFDVVAANVKNWKDVLRCVFFSLKGDG